MISIGLSANNANVGVMIRFLVFVGQLRQPAGGYA
jgi:hypothetical protein